jgi:hypothetical protein
VPTRRVGLFILIVGARSHMPTKYDRFDIDCGREGPYADQVRSL